MNLFDCVTCNQYYELIKTGRNGNKALLNGNMLNTTCVVLLLLTICNFIFMNETIENNFSETIGSIFGERSGKGLGELIALPVWAVVFFIIKNTTGTKRHFKE